MTVRDRVMGQHRRSRFCCSSATGSLELTLIVNKSPPSEETEHDDEVLCH